MNYFELYNLPVSFLPNKQLVKERFYELSRKYHPDFFTNTSPEEQADILEKSSIINKAYKVFQNKDETIKYILQQKDLLAEEEKYLLPPDFLMDVMELNEQLTEARMEGNNDQVKNIQNAISNLQTQIYEPVKKTIEHYEETLSSEKELLQVKEYYYKKKYLNRILAAIS